jgi:transglutaminase-like putative cysteine protease
VLLDRAVVRMHPNGLSETFEQRVVRVLDARGARSEADYTIRFTPETQSVDLRVARVHRPSGEVVEAVSIDEADLSEPWYGLYYDVKGMVARFPRLEPGDVLDIEYVVSDVGRRNLFADYFGDLHFFQEQLPRRESSYILLSPVGRALYFNEPRVPVGATLDRASERVGDELRTTYTLRDVPKIELEPLMPGLTEHASYLHVSTYRTWQEVATWYEGLVRGQLESNAAIRQAVEEALRGIPAGDERGRIRALYELVIRRTRYVGLEFGIHGYRPYRPAQVFARKFGDCKDKASLLHVMLREAGIPSSLVLTRTRQNGRIDPMPASLAPFDHAIVYVPSQRLFLDGTAEFSGPSELPAQDQGAQVLVVQHGQLEVTPVLPALHNRVTTRHRVQLEESGAAIVDESLEIIGEAAHGWRSFYQSEGEQRDKYDLAWNRRQPGSRVQSVHMELSSLGQPVRVGAKIAVPHFAHRESEGRLGLLVLGREPDLQRSYAALSQRTHDLLLGYPFQQVDQLRVTLPSGWSVERLPPPVQLRSPFGQFELKVTRTGREVVVEALLELSQQRVRPSDYGAFRTFLGEVDRVAGQELSLLRAASTGGAR